MARPASRDVGRAPAAPYAAVAPGPALAPYVARLHVCREHLAPGAVVHEHVLPAGAVRLHLHLGDVPQVAEDATPLGTLGAGAPAAEPGLRAAWATEASGATCAADVVRLAGRVEGVSVELRPGAALALLGVPAGELAGRSRSLEALWGGEAVAVLDRVADAPYGPARAAAVERALLARLARRGGRAAARDDAGARTAAAVLRRVEAAGGRVTVRAAAAAAGVGTRRLEQLFHAHVGLTPKAACRLARFQASLRLVRRAPALGWADVAFACGFADQAHLAHEYRAIAGLTPGAVRARLGPSGP